MAQDLAIAIIGGGIGGLAAALSLVKAGFDAHVYEQAPELREVGAGIVVSPNATRILDRLGLSAALAQSSVRPLAWHERRWDDGRTLLRVPLADAEMVASDSADADPILERRLRGLLEELAPAARAVIVLRYQEDLDPVEIGRTLKMSVNTVKSHLKRSLALLRAALAVPCSGAGGGSATPPRPLPSGHRSLI